ncbi:unnamed protein product [Urochloa decumbens]|uniref:Uncharacterized protein n=1 Tax=Urochloa decumbens TaxID=240449 RepID=A0ABC8VB23_9POAL
MPIPAPSAAPALSSLHSLSSHYFLLLPAHFLPPGGVRPPLRRGDLAIRNGGGPRTFPGGVSKWQWKRMQAKKARQLLKARLARERQLYEMRKRTELRDAVAHLERPWDPDSAAAEASAVAPNLLSVAADDQLRALADRFHRPGGVDLWNDHDGPRVFASPATGASSARFFPKNAVHSVQPYALVGDGGEGSATRARGSAADLLLLGRGDGGAQGVRENATETQDRAYRTGDDEPAVQLMERDGTWEPVDALDDGDDGIAGYWSSDDDSNAVLSESEDTGDVHPRHVPRAMILRRNGRNNGVARWEAAAMAAGSDEDRGWSGDTFFSDSERAREGHREQRWQERSGGASTRKRVGGRRHTSNTAANNHVGPRGRTGAGSFFDSEVIHGGSEQKWRPRTRDGNRNGARSWNAPRQDWIGGEFNKNSDSARGGKTESKWGTRNKSYGRENFRGKSKPEYSADTSGRDVPGRNMNANNGDEHQSSNNGHRRYQFGGGFAKDPEAPTWKPKRMNRARNNNGDGRDNRVNGRFRSSDNARRLQESPRNTSREDGRRMNRNVGQRFRGDDYSLRPTSELHTSWRETGSDEL